MKLNKIARHGSVLLALGMVGCATPAPVQEAPPQTNLEADIQAVHQLLAEENRGWNSGDVDAVMATIAEDAVWMQPYQPPAVGRQAVREWVSGIMAKFEIKSNEFCEEVHVGGDWAICDHRYSATNTPKAGGEPVEDRGGGIGIAKRQADNSWKWMRASSHSHLPAGAIAWTPDAPQQLVIDGVCSTPREGWRWSLRDDARTVATWGSKCSREPFPEDGLLIPLTRRPGCAAIPPARAKYT